MGTLVDVLQVSGNPSCIDLLNIEAKSTMTSEMSKMLQYNTLKILSRVYLFSKMITNPLSIYPDIVSPIF